MQLETIDFAVKSETAQSPVKRVDHIMVRGPDNAKLLNVLTQTLGLPVAWPVKHTPFFSSAGVHLGNLNLEIITLEQDSDLTRYFYYGLVFELAPYTVALPELKAREVLHTPPMPFVLPDEQGWLQTTWSNIYLGGLFSTAVLQQLFFALSQRIPFSAWERGTYPTWFNLHVGLPILLDIVYPDAIVFTVEYNRSWYGESIESNPGFPGLEVVEVAEVLVGVKDFKQSAGHWRNLLSPLKEPKPGIWVMPDGLRLRLKADLRDRVRALTLRVKSLNRAAQFLHQQGLLGKQTTSMITIDPGKIYGLDIRLIG